MWTVEWKFVLVPPTQIAPAAKTPLQTTTIAGTQSDGAEEPSLRKTGPGGGAQAVLNPTGAAINGLEEAASPDTRPRSTEKDKLIPAGTPASPPGGAPPSAVELTSTGRGEPASATMPADSPQETAPCTHTAAITGSGGGGSTPAGAPASAPEEAASLPGGPTGIGGGGSAHAQAEGSGEGKAEGGTRGLRNLEPPGGGEGGTCNGPSVQRNGNSTQEDSGRTPYEKCSKELELQGNKAPEGALSGQCNEKPEGAPQGLCSGGSEGAAVAQDAREQQPSGRGEGGGSMPLWEEAARAWGAVGPSLDRVEVRLRKQTPEAVIVTS